MAPEEAYLKIVENWLRQWRTIVFPAGSIDDLCERITMVMQEAADEVERLRLYKEKNESLLIAAAGEQQAEVERLHDSVQTAYAHMVHMRNMAEIYRTEIGRLEVDNEAISQTASDYLHEIAELESWFERKGK